MIAKGTLTLGSTVEMTTVAGNTPQLLMHAFEPGKNPNGTAWRLVWTGDRAKLFYEAHAHELRIGKTMEVQAINPQAHITGGESFVLAAVVDIQIITPTPRTRWAGDAPYIYDDRRAA